jgi:putative FmdB family regulatory protein
MPIYEYLCPQEHRFELKQSFSAETIATCPTCSTQAKRLLNVPAVVYKGSGFYTTDYARKGADSSPAPSEKKSEAKGEAKTETKSEKKDSAATSEKKSEAKSESKSASSEAAPAAAK